MSLSVIFLVVALICFLLAAVGVSSRIGLVPLGLAFCVLAYLIPGFIR